MRQRHYGRAHRIRTQNSVRSSVFSSFLCFTFVQITLGKHVFRGFPGGSAGKESVCTAGDLGSIPGLGRSPGGGNGNPLQLSCLENPVGREAWRAHGVTESRTRLSSAQHTGGAVGKNPSANAGDARDVSSVSGSGRSPE